MAINNALAGVAVRSLEDSLPWYVRLLERTPDTRPMPGVAEWTFANGGCLQVFQDRQRAGASSATLVEDDLGQRLATLRAIGIPVGATSESDVVNTAIVEDPDGNQVVFAEARVEEAVAT